MNDDRALPRAADWEDPEEEPDEGEPEEEKEGAPEEEMTVPLAKGDEGVGGRSAKSLHEVALRLTLCLRTLPEPERQAALELYRGVYRMLAELQREEDKGRTKRNPAGFAVHRD